MTDEEFVQTLVGEELAQYEADAILKTIKMLKTENAELRERFEKTIELPFFQKDGEVIVLIYKNNDGVVLAETYFEDVYYDGKRGNKAAEARLAELKGEKK